MDGMRSQSTSSSISSATRQGYAKPDRACFAAVGADEKLGRSAQRVQDVLAERGIEATVVELPDSTRTAVEAAEAIGCRVEQIAKSVVLAGRDSGRVYLVVASGPRRVDLDAVAALAGEAVGMADAATVRERTGFAVGGVPPMGHREPLATYLDPHLLAEGTIWAAAGTPNAVVRLTADELRSVSGGTEAAVT
jgi:prolyl-tRNA editing enzyme YbaK/EbsC (Cys-tRNA(Pro) deacylase)